MHVLKSAQGPTSLKVVAVSESPTVLPSTGAVPNSGPHNPFPHSLVRTRQFCLPGCGLELERLVLLARFGVAAIDAQYAGRCALPASKPMS